METYDPGNSGRFDGVRRTMFAIKPADGAIGGHVAAVRDCYRALRLLTRKIAEACDLSDCLSTSDIG